MTRPIPPEAERLVRRIKAYNNIWHGLRDGELGDNADVTAVQQLAREAKGMLQVALLRGFPELARLVDDTRPDSKEPLYSVTLATRVAGYTDADHMPARVAKAHLTPHELRDLVEPVERAPTLTPTGGAPR